jgi:hypothetical protein
MMSSLLACLSDPALTRSRRISRSNSAKTASIPANARPLAVVKSKASESDTKPTPSSLSSCRVPMRSSNERPQRSSRHTRMTSSDFGEEVVGEHRDVGTLDASLLEMFPPRPSVRDVIDGNNPSRAIEYWENAIGILKSKPKDESRQPVIAYYGPTRDWGNERPRKDWAGLWLDEPLDIRPAAEATQALSTIAKTARNEAEEESMRAIAERLGIALRTAYALVKDAGAMSVTLRTWA